MYTLMILKHLPLLKSGLEVSKEFRTIGLTQNHTKMELKMVKKNSYKKGKFRKDALNFMLGILKRHNSHLSTDSKLFPWQSQNVCLS